jgi:hypothetical protein
MTSHVYFWNKIFQQIGSQDFCNVQWTMRKVLLLVVPSFFIVPDNTPRHTEFYIWFKLFIYIWYVKLCDHTLKECIYTRTTQHSWCTFYLNKDFPADVAYVRLLRTGRYYYLDSPRCCKTALTDDWKISKACVLYVVYIKQNSPTAE